MTTLGWPQVGYRHSYNVFPRLIRPGCMVAAASRYSDSSLNPRRLVTLPPMHSLKSCSVWSTGESDDRTCSVPSMSAAWLATKDITKSQTGGILFGGPCFSISHLFRRMPASSHPFPTPDCPRHVKERATGSTPATGDSSTLSLPFLPAGGTCLGQPTSRGLQPVIAPAHLEIKMTGRTQQIS